MIRSKEVGSIACCPFALTHIAISNLVQVEFSVHYDTKNRQCGLARNLILLGLAFCVFAWGLQYKLAAFDPHQSDSVRMQKVKLLSKDEQPDSTARPLVIRSKTTVKLIYTEPSGAFFLCLLAFSLLALPQSIQKLPQLNWPRPLGRSLFIVSLFVRPPPTLQ